MAGGLFLAGDAEGTVGATGGFGFFVGTCGYLLILSYLCTHDDRFPSPIV